MDTQQMFLSEVLAHLERTGQSATEFGRSALKDPRFVADLRNGRSPSLRTVERVRNYMREQEPPVEIQPSQGT